MEGAYADVDQVGDKHVSRQNNDRSWKALCILEQGEGSWRCGSREGLSKRVVAQLKPQPSKDLQEESLGEGRAKCRGSEEDTVRWSGWRMVS